MRNIPHVLGGLRTWRQRRQLTQAQLAARAGSTQARISGLECGRRSPTLRTLNKIASALDVTPMVLLTLFNDAGQNREVADRIAHSVVTGERALSRSELQLADEVGSLVIQKLRAHHARGRLRYTRTRWEAAHRARWVRQVQGRRTVEQILKRIDTRLAMLRQ